MKSRDQGAKEIQTRFRAYRTDKQTLTRKDYLLKQNEEKDSTRLFSEVNLQRPEGVAFKKAGWAGLFPRKDTVNIFLLKDYLEKKVDVRYFAREARLRNRISDDKLISVTVDAATYQEWPEVQKTFATIHERNQLTLVGKVFHEYLSHTLPAVIEAQSHEEKTATSRHILHALTHLTAPENYVLCGHFSDAEVCKIAKNIVVRILKKANPLDGIPNRELLFYFFKAIRNIIQSEVRFKANRMLNSLRQFQHELELFCEKIPKDNLDAHLYRVAIEAVISTQELVPFFYDDRFWFFIVRPELKDLHLEAMTGVKPETKVRKIPKYGFVTPKTADRIKEKGDCVVGLLDPEFPIAEKIHTNSINSLPLSYTHFHDLIVHHQYLYYHRVYGEELYQVLQHFCKSIQAVTGKELTHLSTSIFDFHNAYFLERYTLKQKTEEVIFWVFDDISQDVQDDTIDYANREYALIAVCDLLKSEEKYNLLLEALAKKHTPLSCYAMQEILIGSILRVKEDPMLRGGLILPHKHKIKSYSHSLGVFFGLLLLNDHDPKDAILLCDQLKALEDRKKIQFIWNPKGGIILQIDHHRFHFHGKNPAKDFRYGRSLPEGFMRHYSSDPNWLQTLRLIIDKKEDKMETTPKRRFSI